MSRARAPSRSMGPRMLQPGSRMSGGCGRRGTPRKATPQTLVKQMSASTPTSASTAITRADTSTSATRWPTRPLNAAAYTRNSLTNPLNGGKPQIAAEPTMNSAAVTGMRRAMPPIRSRSRVCSRR